MDNEHWHRAARQNRLGNAAIQQVCKSGPTVGRHDDAVRGERSHRRQNLVHGVPVDWHSSHWHARGHLLGDATQVGGRIIHGRQLLSLPIQAARRRPEGRSNEHQPATSLGGEPDRVWQRALRELRSVERNHYRAEHVGTPFCKPRDQTRPRFNPEASMAQPRRDLTTPTGVVLFQPAGVGRTLFVRLDPAWRTAMRRPLGDQRPPGGAIPLVNTHGSGSHHRL